MSAYAMHRLAKLLFADEVSGLKAGSQPSRILGSLAAVAGLLDAGVVGTRCAASLRVATARSPLVALFTTVVAAEAGSMIVGRKALNPLSAEVAT